MLSLPSPSPHPCLSKSQANLSGIYLDGSIGSIVLNKASWYYLNTYNSNNNNNNDNDNNNNNNDNNNNNIKINQ